MCYSLSILLLGLGLWWPALFSPVPSHLLVPAGQQLRLGGNQAREMVVAARNVGPVAVELLAQPVRGQALGRGAVAPEQRVRRQPGAEAALLVRNGSARQAVLTVDSYGEPGFTMTYGSAAGRRANE